ncbi:MAG: HAD family hydrolase, partial [Minisyncoccales bacterium]
MIKAVIFDVGDSLVDVSTWKKILPNALAKFLKKEKSIEEKETLKILKKTMEKLQKMEESNPHIDKIKMASQIFSTEAKKEGYDVEASLIENFTSNFRKENTKLKKGVYNLLRSLKKKYLLFVISDGTKSRVNEHLDRFKIRKFFDGVFISEEEGKTKKDDGELFGIFLKKTGLSPKECIVVGNDPSSDGKCLIFGIPFCLLWEKEERPNCEYNFLISSFEEFPKILSFFEENVTLRCKLCNKKIKNRIICKNCEKNFKQVVKKDKALYSIVEDVGEFTGLSFEKALDKILVGPILVRKDWINIWPTTKKEIEDFYINNKNYIFDLSLANMHKKWRRQNMQILKYAKKNKIESVLDFGSGIGELAILL